MNNPTLEKELIAIIERDQWMIDVLRIVRDLGLNDCWIGAGFVRNKIWDVKHRKPRTNLNDIDVIHFDKSYTNKEYDLEIENRLKRVDYNLNWSVKNQARMHLRNNDLPYANCEEAISFWPETATAVAIRLTPENQIECIAPYGLDDLFNLLIRPTPGFDLKVYRERVTKKKWSEKWDQLEIKTGYSHV